MPPSLHFILFFFLSHHLGESNCGKRLIMTDRGAISAQITWSLPLPSTTFPLGLHTASGRLAFLSRSPSVLAGGRLFGWWIDE